MTYCNVGWKLAVADVNGDGQDDLLISTPFIAASGSQRGCVASLYAHTHLTGNKRTLQLLFHFQQKSLKIHCNISFIKMKITLSN